MILEHPLLVDNMFIEYQFVSFPKNKKKVWFQIGCQCLCDDGSDWKIFSQ